MGKKKDKKVKKTVVFDESDRIDFITGFKKRKDERRAKAMEIKEQLIKEARQKAKQAKRDEIKKLLINYQMENPELSDLIKPVNLDLPEHLVTITEMDLSQMARLTNSGLGSNNEEQMKDVDQATKSSSKLTSKSSFKSSSKSSTKSNKSNKAFKLLKANKQNKSKTKKKKNKKRK